MPVLSLLGLLLMPVLAVYATGAGLAIDASLAINTVLFLGTYGLAIAIHETGHALGANATGLKAHSVQIGRWGPEVARRRVGDVLLSVRFPPDGGLTLFGSPVRTWRRLRIWLTILAGPAATAAAGALALVAIGTPMREVGIALASRVAPVELFVLSSAVVLLVSLVPLPSVSETAPAMSDGLRLLVVPFARESTLGQMLSAGSIFRAAELIRQKDIVGAETELRRGLEAYPQDWLLRFVLASVLNEPGNIERSYELLKGLRVEEAPTVTLRAMLLNQRAWAYLLGGNPADMQAADDESRRACSLYTENPSYADTRGHVLAWVGRPAEARRSFEFAYERGELPQTRASAACGLAMTFAAAGDRTGATEWLARAREADPNNVQLAAAEKAVSDVSTRA